MIYNIFLIESPFQLLCAAEALKHFNNKGVLIVKYSGRIENDKQIKELIWKYSWSEVLEFYIPCNGNVFLNLLRTLKFILSLKRVALRYRKRANKIFIGEFRSGWMHVFRSYLQSRETFLLDDGDITIIVQEFYFRNGKYIPFNLQWSFSSSFKDTVKFFYYLPFLPGLKYIQNEIINLFTIFDLDPLEGQSVIKNDLSLFRPKVLKKSKEKVVYYLGSKYSEAGVLMMKDEVEFVKKITKYYKEKGVNFCYISHRDDSTEKLNEIQEVCDVNIRTLGLPIELYFLKSNTYPMYVAGAYSTALYSLNKILPECGISSFKLPSDRINEKFRKDVELSYRKISENKIEVINLN